jgi:hypothetical protein
MAQDSRAIQFDTDEKGVHDKLQALATMGQQFFSSSQGKTAFARWVELGCPEFKTTEDAKVYIASVAKSPSLSIAGNPLRRAYKLLVIGMSTAGMDSDDGVAMNALRGKRGLSKGFKTMLEKMEPNEFALARIVAALCGSTADSKEVSFSCADETQMLSVMRRVPTNGVYTVKVPSLCTVQGLGNSSLPAQHQVSASPTPAPTTRAQRVVA